MQQLTNLSIDWFELCLIFIFQGAALLLLLSIGRVRRKIRSFLDKNKISIYAWVAVVTFLAIIYRDSLQQLLLQPPSYALYLGVFLVLLSWILSTNQKNYEVTTMSTTKDIARVDEKLSDLIEEKLPTANAQLKRELKEELSKEFGEQVKTIVADTVKQTLAAVKQDPSILQ